MVGKSVTGALVSGAVLAAPAAAETSLRRLSTTPNITTNLNDVVLKYIQLPYDNADPTDAQCTAIATAIKEVLDHADFSMDCSDITVVLDSSSGTCATYNGNTLTVHLSAVNLHTNEANKAADFAHLQKAVQTVGNGGDADQHAALSLRVAQNLAQVDANVGDDDFEALGLPEACATIPASVSVFFSTLPDDALTPGSTDRGTLATKFLAEVRKSFASGGAYDGLSEVAEHSPENKKVEVRSNGEVRFNFVANCHSDPFDVSAEADAIKYYNMKRTVETDPLHHSFIDSQMRTGFSQVIACRMKDQVPDGWTLDAPSDTMCNEILGISADPDNDGTGESSEESTDESSSARSVAVVSFLSTAAAAAALF